MKEMALVLSDGEATLGLSNECTSNFLTVHLYKEDDCGSDVIKGLSVTETRRLYDYLGALLERESLRQQWMASEAPFQHQRQVELEK